MVVLLLIPQPLIHNILILLIKVTHSMLRLIFTVLILLIVLLVLIGLLKVLHIAVKLVRHLDSLILFGALILTAALIHFILPIHTFVLLITGVALNLALLLQLLGHILLTFTLAHARTFNIIRHLTALTALAALLLLPRRAEALCKELGEEIE